MQSGQSQKRQVSPSLRFSHPISLSKASSCAPVALTETAQDGIFHWELQGNCTGCRRFLDDAGQRAMSSLRQAGLLSADDPVSRQEVVGRLYLT
ncbi:rCG46591, isoform CRA_a [Rattus norvegicus]|uniref:RCG46591, isoform CRA_a n=1 Tax=Rattus norvegicus TaxID=10116 RepID=A6IXU3_RAT|nr:rCG46591, isoform CRA_a [Rattus norvegicus]